MAFDFNEVKRIIPQRRIDQLKSLIETFQQEIKEKQQDIEEAERMLAEAQDEAKLIEQVEVPQTIEAKVKKPLEKKEDLEDLLATAPKQKLIEEASQRPVSELYGTLKSIYTRQKETGVETNDDRTMIYAIRKGIEVKKQEGYKPNATQEHLMTAAEKMAEAMYKNITGTYKKE